MGKKIKMITDKYPASSFNNLDTPYEEWHDEGFEIASHFIYRNIEEHSAPSEEYLKEGLELALK